jgi:hypothetical protein
MDVLSELIKIADTLDEVGLYTLANEIDEVVREEYSARTINPQYSMVFEDIKSALANALKEEEISQEVLEKVFSIINNVQKESFKYNIPVRERYIPREEQGQVVPRKIFEMAESLRSLINDKKELVSLIQQTEDQEALRNLQIELRENNDKIEERNIQLEGLRTGSRPNDQQYYKIIVDYVHSESPKKLIPREGMESSKDSSGE